MDFEKKPDMTGSIMKPKNIIESLYKLCNLLGYNYSICRVCLKICHPYKSQKTCYGGAITPCPIKVLYISLCSIIQLHVLHKID